MPKRVGYIYSRMDDRAFIARSAKIGTRESKKKKRRDVRRVLDNWGFYGDATLTMVRERSFKPEIPRKKTIYDPSSQKWRDTYRVSFWPDGLMHIMVCQAMMDVLMRGMSPWTCSAIPQRGGQRVRKRLRHAMQDRPKQSTYAGESDVKSYYDSIPLDRLMVALERKIKDQEFLLLVAICITCEQISLREALERGLHWRDITRGRVGLYIGLYIDQWLANFYLEPLDHMILAHPGVKFTTRHMDNIVITGPNKKKLHAAMRDIERGMNALGLKMKGDWQVYRTTFTRKAQARRLTMTERQRRLRHPRMVAAVGYRYGHNFTTMRKRNFLRFTRQCRRVKKKIDARRPIPYQQACALLSRIGQLKHCDSHNARVKYVDPIGVKNLKEVVRYESKRRLAAQQRFFAGGAA